MDYLFGSRRSWLGGSRFGGLGTVRKGIQFGNAIAVMQRAQEGKPSPQWACQLLLRMISVGSNKFSPYRAKRQTQTPNRGVRWRALLEVWG